MTVKHTVLLTLAIGALVPGAAASAAVAEPAKPTKTRWATVNICDTVANPDTLGVRASVPGNGTSERIYMRFRAEYFDRSRKAWRPVKGQGVSPFVHAGSARFRTRETGYRFLFPSDTAATFQLRGRVQVEYRRARTGRGERVVRRVALITSSGVVSRSPAEGDPRGYSAARCEMKVEPRPEPDPLP